MYNTTPLPAKCRPFRHASKVSSVMESVSTVMDSERTIFVSTNEIWPVHPRMLGKSRLRATRCTNNQRQRSLWGGSICSMRSRFRVKTPCFSNPQVTPGFGREFDLWTHTCSGSLGWGLQRPVISANRAYGGCIYSMRSRLSAKTLHFDGLVRTPLSGPRILMANRICPKSPIHTVFANTIKSGIRFILARCIVCSRTVTIFAVFATSSGRDSFYVHTYTISVNFQVWSSWQSWFMIPPNTHPVKVLSH